MTEWLTARLPEPPLAVTVTIVGVAVGGPGGAAELLEPPHPAHTPKVQIMRTRIAQRKPEWRFLRDAKRNRQAAALSPPSESGSFRRGTVDAARSDACADRVMVSAVVMESKPSSKSCVG